MRVVSEIEHVRLAASTIGICASTGGPRALATLLAEFPATFPIPILVVQHITPDSVGSFVRWLDAEVALPVRLAAAALPAAGVWVAPADAHLTLDAGGRIALDDRSDAGPHRPSGDVLLRSLATTAGRNAVAVVLTGTGRDGARGLADVRRVGGLTIAQDEATSTAYGMPRAAAESGAELVMSLAEIAPRLSALRQAF